ncbi:hypothetical protein A6B43_00850 [Vespertiliibacter pulmonis]|uniref:UPF0319 protein EDC46_0555 n=1 Tax=Vespertiliibacter pulmonis TaxID=1443036 RepID=A0A3N4VSS6_9PAST|nr:DUF2057 domain-containing protein [Vespertiliibacter pulmonis]QLB20188.1 hypothetical protein A6B43_00850 [Vespertiliibacter pulmonis]RPE86162.1 hypothetical protein EDC46_0555 [Vespertiliibacter pulmonis]
MKLAKIALAIIPFALANSALAGTVTHSSNIDILAFDGQKFKKKSTMQITDEKTHQIVLTVSNIYQSGSDTAFFESSPIVLTFNGSQENIQISTPTFHNRFDIEKFKENPTFTVKTVSGKELSYKQDYLKGEGFMPNANILGNLTAYNSGDGAAAVKQFATTTMPAVMPLQVGNTAKGKVVVQGENIVEQQLQYWFQQADKETQKRFLEWAKKH